MADEYMQSKPHLTRSTTKSDALREAPVKVRELLQPLGGDLWGTYRVWVVTTMPIIGHMKLKSR